MAKGRAPLLEADRNGHANAYREELQDGREPGFGHGVSRRSLAPDLRGSWPARVGADDAAQKPPATEKRKFPSQGHLQ